MFAIICIETFIKYHREANQWKHIRGDKIECNANKCNSMWIGSFISAFLSISKEKK